MAFTSTFAVLEVAPSTFADIKRRLNKVGVLPDYLQKGDKGDEYKWLIVFGTTALAVENRKRRK